MSWVGRRRQSWRYFRRRPPSPCLMTDILVLYDSRHGSVRDMARLVTRGAASIPDVNTILRSIPPVSLEHNSVAPDIPDEGDPFVEVDELKRCDGLLLGSPIYFGNMASPTTTNVSR